MGTPLTISIASEQPLDPQAYRDLLAIFQVDLKDQISIAPATFQIPVAWKDELIPELEPTGATVRPVRSMGIDAHQVKLVLDIIKTSIEIAIMLYPLIKKWHDRYGNPTIYVGSNSRSEKELKNDDEILDWIKKLFK